MKLKKFQYEISIPPLKTDPASGSSTRIPPLSITTCIFTGRLSEALA